MSRLQKFTSVFGENWLVGRHLLPELTRIGRQQRGTVLDLACGESPFRDCFPLADRYLRVDRQPRDSEVVSGDMLSVPLPDASADMILLFQAITDVPYPVEVLREARRLLRSDGRLLVFESMAYPEHDAPYDYYRLMPEGLRVLARDAGLQVHECMPMGGLFTRFASLWNTFVMGQLKRHALLRPLARVGIAGGNLFCCGLDRLASHPRLASDYLAILGRSEPAAAADAMHAHHLRITHG